jgi:hypothetical protein
LSTSTERVRKYRQRLAEGFSLYQLMLPDAETELMLTHSGLLTASEPTHADVEAALQKMNDAAVSEYLRRLSDV